MGTGYRDFYYSPASAPTADKPQSKLWFNDGIWWASAFSRSDRAHHIYRLDWNTQTWSDTGVVIDTRDRAKVDTLWDGTRLYVAAAGPSSSSSSDSARILSFSYDGSSKTYSLDSGFPVTITNGGIESIVIEKDTTGTLWATFTQGSRVLVAHSATDDATWTAPSVLPVSGASNLTTDDIAAVKAFGTKIGVLWSNQNDEVMYFAVHNDGAPDDQWTVEIALAGPEVADDHINLASDSSGRVYAATKTSLDGSADPLIVLLVREVDGTWNSHTFGRVAENHTRPIVLVDDERDTLYMFASAPCCSGAVVYLKQSSLSNISLAPGLGIPFIESATDTKINNPTSTKQMLSSATGLVVLAGDDGTRFYLHNQMPLP